MIPLTFLAIASGTLVAGAKVYGKLSQARSQQAKLFLSTPRPQRSDDSREIKALVVSSYTALDTKYQTFMRQRFDPLFGRKRSQQLDALASHAEGGTISQHEQSLNRKIACITASLAAIAIGVSLYPPSLIISVPASLLLTIPVYKKAFDVIKNEHRVNFHVLSAINITGIWIGGFFIPAALGMVLYFLAEKLLVITQERSHQGLISIFGQQARYVWVVLDDVEVEVPFDQLQPGDTVVVEAGQMLPADGTITSGMASIDQHVLTGEAQPVEKAPGDLVYASTVVLAGKVYIRVEKAGEETVAAQIGAILNRTASYQTTLQSKGSALAHASALPTLLLGSLAWATIHLEQGLAILNSAFGGTLRITAPIAMLNFLNIASHNGILVKDGRSLELLKDVDTVVFDKTGTLTLDQPTVVRIYSCNGLHEDMLLTYAATAEHRQTHPIAKAIRMAADDRDLCLPDIEDAMYEVGYGIKVSTTDKLIRVGSDRFMALEGVAVPPDLRVRQDTCHQQGHSLVMVAIDDELGGAIELQPTLRPEVQDVIDVLHGRGLSLAIISGDQEEPTRKLAQQLGIERYFANTLPEHKAELVEQLQRQGRAVCFVGDGINDSIALKKANVSVSLRGATTVAIDTAQIVLTDQTLKPLTHLFDLADEFDANLKAGFASAIVPGVINIGGVFLFHWSILTALAIFNFGLLTSLGIATLPLLRHSTD
uniref:ORF2 n=1 Tax=uncultured bacterial symbiont of Discodermia dissoluta TaxID=323654 RepID=Q49HK0_9BACT|nr:ORF2 [uncultured bacterial symbiont of Discodermia dissoluta]